MLGGITVIDTGWVCLTTQAFAMFMPVERVRVGIGFNVNVGI